MLTKLEPYMTLPNSEFYSLLDADERELLAVLIAVKAECAYEAALKDGVEFSIKELFNTVRRLFEKGLLVLASRVLDGEEQYALVACDSEDAQRMKTVN